MKQRDINKYCINIYNDKINTVSGVTGIPGEDGGGREGNKWGRRATADEWVMEG